MSMPGRSQYFTATISLLVLGLAAGSATAQDKPPIKIGFAVAQSGFMSAYDIPSTNAALLAIDEINAQGGLLGRKIEPVVRDMKTDAAQSAKVGAELASEGVDLIVTTSDYDLGGPAALAAKDKGIIAFSPGAADPKMGVQGVGWKTFTANGAAQLEGIVMAEWGFKKKGFKTAYVLQDDLLEYNKSGCAGFRAAWTNLAGEKGIVGRDDFMNSDPSIAVQISRLKRTQPAPDVIYMCTIPPGGASAIRQIRAAGIETPIFANVGMTDDFWISATPDLSNFYNPTMMSIFGDDPSPLVQKFVAAYTKKYGTPVPQAYASVGYLVIQEWSTAVKRAGTTDAKAVVAELEKFKDEELLLGPTTFTHELHIQTHRPLLIMEVQNGKHHSLERWRNEMIPDTDLLFRVGKYQ
jgi:branched-chain amino acid transport system substrate-binding protein